MPVQPLAYGYVSMPESADERDVALWRTAIAEVARREGYALAGLFVDHDGKGNAFRTMHYAILRTGAEAVVVPSLAHLASVPTVARANVRRVSLVLGARLLVMQY